MARRGAFLTHGCASQGGMAGLLQGPRLPGEAACLCHLVAVSGEAIGWRGLMCRRRAGWAVMAEGTTAHDGHPIIRVLARATGKPCVWGCDHADTRTCRALLADHMPAGSSRLSTDAWQRSRGRHVAHGMVRHG